MSAALEWARALDPRWALAILVLAVNLWSTGLLILGDGSRREKALWAAVIFLCPVVGSMFWFVFGPSRDM